jgi:hypothetical protein
MLLQELPQRLRLDAVRGLKHIKEAALELALPDNTTKTGTLHIPCTHVLHGQGQEGEGGWLEGSWN